MDEGISADWPSQEEDEVEESKMLWESQIADLKQVLGSS